MEFLKRQLSQRRTVMKILVGQFGIILAIFSKIGTKILHFELGRDTQICT